MALKKQNSPAGVIGRKERKMDCCSRFDGDVSKMGVGVSIVVNAWGKFPSRTLKCTGTVYDKKYKVNRFVFDCGLEWSESNLVSNFALWESRNGYQIIEA